MSSPQAFYRYHFSQHLKRSCNRFKRPFSVPYYSTSAPTSPSEAEARAARDYCASLLQRYDTPSHTLLAFIPPASQPAYLALRAFNLEIARIPDSASTTAIRTMRYQFWRDNITRAFAGTPSKHPVPILLAHALDDLATRSNNNTATLSKTWFTRIITARETYSDNRPYATLDALEKYAEDTYSTLLYLTLQSLPLASITADHIASHIGKAAGITAVLRGVPLLAFPAPANHHSNAGQGAARRTSPPPPPHHQQQGTISLPLDIMARTGLRDEDVFRHGAHAAGLRDAVFEVATRASDHLITARQMVRNVRVRGNGDAVGNEAEEEDVLEKAFGVFLPAVSTRLWLDRLERVDFDVFRDELRRREWRLPFWAFWACRRWMF